MLNVRDAVIWLFIVCAFSGCRRMTWERGSEDLTHRTSVSFNIGVVNAGTVWQEGEAGIKDVNIYVYRNGSLEDYVYTEDITKAGMYLESGREYRFYALANKGQLYPPLDERSLKNSRYSIRELSELGAEGLPMSAVSSAIVSGAHCSVSLSLSPVAAKIGLKVEVPSSGNFRLESVRIVNPAEDYSPFSDGYKAKTVLGAYSASQDEIEYVREGRIIYVSVLENCQGVLFPDNEDSRDKTPDNLPAGKQSGCTCLEITVAGDGGSADSGRVYSLCLGADAVSDCNIVRDTYSLVTLRLTGNGPRDYIWEVRSGANVPGIRFVAAGESGNVLYTDSQGEIIEIRVGDVAWRDIIYASGKYVMAGDDGRLAYSPDGETWQVTEAGTAHWQALAYGNGRYVAVGYRMSALSGRAYPRKVNGYAAVSTDGISWQVTEKKGYCMEDVAYGKGTFAATGYYMTAAGGITSGHFFASSDGESWRVCKGFQSDFPCLVYGKDGFVAMSDGYLAYSPDGISWQNTEDTGFRLVYNLAYGEGTYAGPDIFGRAVYSVGGIGWTRTETGAKGYSGIFYSKGCFLMPGDGGLLMFSDNGKAWRKAETGSSVDLYCAAVRY